MTYHRSRQVRVVITRSRDGNKELAKSLEQVGLYPVSIDTISIAPLDDWSEADHNLKRLASFDWLVFTSAQGAKHFGIRMRELSQPLPWEGKPRVAAVGRQTAKALLALGVGPDFVPSSYTTELLAEELPADPGAKILLLRADIADRRLFTRLTEREFIVEDTAVYRTLPAKGHPPKTAGADLVVFASSSAVRGLCALVPEEELRALKRLKTICIGPVTESAARENGFVNTTTPHPYTLNAVIREVARLSHEHA